MPLPPPPDTRYERLCLLGRGGMGEVWRVHDRHLDRTLAMKLVARAQRDRPGASARFEAEARCAAALQHPGIVPVHDLGELADGTLFFTMREVHGQTLTSCIAALHAGQDDLTLHRLVDALHRACEAVAWAHARGVVHQDLKPDNIMLGSHGEVLVVDWGLAAVLDPGQRARASGGTAAYMAPEQRQHGGIDARTDVWALGATLHHLLTGRPPGVGGGDAASTYVIDDGPPGVAPTAAAAEPLDGPLAATARRAMADAPAARFAHAGELASELAAWLEGARRRSRALQAFERAVAVEEEEAELRARADGLRARGSALLAAVAPWAPEEEKAEGWDLLDQADALDGRATHAELRQAHGLYGALRIDPTLPEAHARLAARHLAAHRRAEAARDEAGALRSRLSLGEHLRALPAAHPVRVEATAWLRGDGAVTLQTDPPGAEILLHRYVRRRRRLVPVFDRSLGRGPLVEHALPMGSYLCVLRLDGHDDVAYPVHIGRGEHWHGVPPGGSAPRPVRLPRTGELPPDVCYVPAGWFQAGGDPQAVDSLAARRLWCDGFVLQRHPVTNRGFIAFLDDLVAQGREDEAMRWVPREEGGTVGVEGAPIYGRDPDGRFVLRPDSQGDQWHPDWPVIMLQWGAAAAWAAWMAARTGAPWRLPAELEWEKAARGVDGRFHPWGDSFDPSWACVRDSHEGRILPARVDRFPVDTSPYGVRGLAGNVRDWCRDPWRREGPPCADDRVPIEPVTIEPVDLGREVRRVSRGGFFFGIARNARCAYRNGNAPENRIASLGLRGAFSFPLVPPSSELHSGVQHDAEAPATLPA